MLFFVEGYIIEITHATIKSKRIKGVSEMSSKGLLSLQLDEQLIQEAIELFQEMGMDLTTAITAFLEKSVAEQAVSLEVSCRPTQLVQAAKALESGKGFTAGTKRGRAAEELRLLKK